MSDFAEKDMNRAYGVLKQVQGGLDFNASDRLALQDGGLKQ